MFPYNPSVAQHFPLLTGLRIEWPLGTLAIMEHTEWWMEFPLYQWGPTIVDHCITSDNYPFAMHRQIIIGGKYPRRILVISIMAKSDQYRATSTTTRPTVAPTIDRKWVKYRSTTWQTIPITTTPCTVWSVTNNLAHPSLWYNSNRT